MILQHCPGSKVNFNRLFCPHPSHLCGLVKLLDSSLAYEIAHSSRISDSTWRNYKKLVVMNSNFQNLGIFKRSLFLGFLYQAS